MNPDDILIDPDFDTMGAWSRSAAGQRDTDRERARRERRKVRRARIAGRFSWMESE